MIIPIEACSDSLTKRELFQISLWFYMIVFNAEAHQVHTHTNANIGVQPQCEGPVSFLLTGRIRCKQ